MDERDQHGRDVGATGAAEELLHAQLRAEQLKAELDVARDEAAELRAQVAQDAAAPPPRPLLRRPRRALSLLGFTPREGAQRWVPGVTIRGVARDALSVDGAWSAQWELQRLYGLRFESWVAVAPQAWELIDGPVRFTVSVTDVHGYLRAERSLLINPRRSPEDRRWHRLAWELPDLGRGTVRLSTELVGDISTDYAWLLWGEPGIVRGPGGSLRWQGGAQLRGLRSRARRRTQPAPEPAAPTVSLLMPVHDPKPEWLAATLASVAAQHDPRWQLCIADDGSRDPAVRQLIAEAVAGDARICATRHEAARGISAATNAALAMATGPLVGTLDHDDLLEPGLVGAWASVLARRPDVAMIYADNAKVAAVGLPFAPALKPGWSPDLMHSVMYTLHPAAYRRELVEQLGGWRSEFDGAQDHDLVLRLTELSEAIEHVPGVLYHWRAHTGSAALGALAKPDAYERGRAAVAEHLERRGIQASVQRLGRPGLLRVDYPRGAAPLTCLLAVDDELASDPVAAVAAASALAAQLRADDEFALLPASLAAARVADRVVASLDRPARVAAPARLGEALAAAAKHCHTLVLIAELGVEPAPDAVATLAGLVDRGGAAAAAGLVTDPAGAVLCAGTAYPDGLPLPRFAAAPSSGAHAPDGVLHAANVLSVRGVVALRADLLHSAPPVDRLDLLALDAVTLAAAERGERVVVEPAACFVAAAGQGARLSRIATDEFAALDRGARRDPYVNPLRSTSRADDTPPPRWWCATQLGRERWAM